MGAGELLLAALAFVGSHFALSSAPLRAPLVARLGERPFSGVYSAVAGVTILWMISAFARAPYTPLWDTPGWARHAPEIVMPIALLAFVCSVTQRNPTAVMAALPAAGEAPAWGLLKVTRHPLLWSFTLWAIAHIVVNGELAALILFGAIGLLALIGMPVLDAKRRARDPEGFARYAAATSVIPFAAMIQGRAQLRFSDIGWMRIGLAAAIYIALVLLHPIFTGGHSAVG